MRLSTKAVPLVQVLIIETLSGMQRIACHEKAAHNAVICSVFALAAEFVMVYQILSKSLQKEFEGIT